MLTPLDLAAVEKAAKEVTSFDTAAAFIALANPATILALCERIREPAKVKPIGWVEDYVRRQWWGNVTHHIGPGYLVAFDGRWCINGAERIWVLDQAGDVDAAKAACQADYDSRIRSALITETNNG